MAVRTELSALVLGGLLLGLSGCSVENSAANASEAEQTSAAYAPNAATPEKMAAIAPDNATAPVATLSGTKCFARKDDKGAGGVRLTFESSGAAKGIYYATTVNAADGAYSGSFGEARGQLTGSTLSINLDPKGGTTRDVGKIDEQWTLSDKGFANGATLYAPADCAAIDAEYEKRSNEE